MIELLAIFQPGEEGFFDLLRDPNHLLFEFVTGMTQTILFDGLLLAVIWPFIRRHFHRDIEDAAKTASGGWPVRVNDKRSHEGHNHE